MTLLELVKMAEFCEKILQDSHITGMHIPLKYYKSHIPDISYKFPKSVKYDMGYIKFEDFSAYCTKNEIKMVGKGLPYFIVHVNLKSRNISTIISNIYWQFYDWNDDFQFRSTHRTWTENKAGQEWAIDHGLRIGDITDDEIMIYEFENKLNRS